MEPVEPLEDMSENCEEHALFFEFVLEDWPALQQMTQAEKQRLYAVMEAELQRLHFPVQVIKASDDKLHLVVQHSVNHSIDDAIQVMEAASRKAAAGREDQHWTGDVSVSSLSPTTIPDAIIRILSKA